MSDIFVSYSSQDRARVKPFVQFLVDAGWSVWWDQRIDPGHGFDDEIDKEILGAKCVIVCWTAASVESRWVCSEALEGSDRGILIPVLFDDARIPIAFRSHQCVRLLNWPGLVEPAELKKLTDKVESLLRDTPSSEQPVSATPAKSLDTTRSMAVMPFAEHRAEQSNNYLSEELILALAEIDPLRLTSAEVVDIFVRDGLDLLAVGRAAKVDYVLSGSLADHAGQTRVKSSLVEVASGQVVWSEIYHVDPTVTDLEVSLTARLVAALKLRLFGESAEPPGTLSAEAYDLVLRADYQLYRYSALEMKKAKKLFAQAAELDPRYTRALIGLCDADLHAAIEGFAPSADCYAQIDERLDRIDSLQPGTPAAAALRAALLSFRDYAWLEASEHFSDLLGDNPDDVFARYLYAQCYLCSTGRISLALKNLRYVERVEPHSMRFKTASIWLLYLAGRHDDVLRKCDETDRLHPDLLTTLVTRGWSYAHLGQAQEAETAFDKVGQIFGFGGMPALARYHLTNDESLLQKHIKQLEANHVFSGAANLSRAYRLAGDYDKMVELMGVAIQHQEPQAITKLFLIPEELQELDGVQALKRSVGLDDEARRQLFENEPKIWVQ